MAASSASLGLGDAFASSAGRALDALYSRITRLNGKFFADGWGDLDLVRIDAAREAAAAVSRRAAGAAAAAAAKGEAAADAFRPDWRLLERRSGAYSVYEARFESPAADASLPALAGPLLPRESRYARARLILPDGGGRGGASSPFSSSASSSGGGADGIVVHLPATGDHDWARRTRLAIPLAMGLAPAPIVGASPAAVVRTMASPPPRLGALLLEGPFYGARRPEGQRGAKIRSVADLFVLGWATIAEALLLAGWARGESARQGVCGLSMGGVHAAMAAALSPHPLAVAPLLAPRSAVAPYVDGALAPSVAVEALSGGAGFGPTFFGPGVVVGAAAAASSSEAAMAASAAASAAATAADAAAAAAEAAALPPAGPRCLRRVAAAVRAASQGFVDDAAAAAAAAGEGGDEEEGGGGNGGGLRMPRAARALAALDALEAELHRAEAEATAMRARPDGGGGGAAADQGSAPSSSPPPSSSAAAAAAATAAVAAVAAAVASAAAARLSFFRREVQQQQREDHQRQQRQRQQQQGEPHPHGLAWLSLRAALEAYTDITRYPLPVRCDAAVMVAARDDAYAPPRDVRALHAHWPGSEMRVVPGGHVTAFLLQQGAFRAAVADSVARLI